MSQGRGYSLGEEISIDYVHRGEGEGEEQLLVCRPMGQVLSKEIAYYTRTEGLESLVVVNEDTSVGGFAPSGGHAGRDIKKIAIGQLVEGTLGFLVSRHEESVLITKRKSRFCAQSRDAVPEYGLDHYEDCSQIGNEIGSSLDTLF